MRVLQGVCRGGVGGNGGRGTINSMNGRGFGRVLHGNGGRRYNTVGLGREILIFKKSLKMMGMGSSGLGVVQRRGLLTTSYSQGPTEVRYLLFHSFNSPLIIQ